MFLGWGTGYSKKSLTMVWMPGDYLASSVLSRHPCSSSSVGSDRSVFHIAACSSKDSGSLLGS